MARSVTEAYKTASKKEKSAMAWELIQQVKALVPPGRFLRRIDNGTWEEVDIHAAREKAGQCLRDAVSQEKLDTSTGRGRANSCLQPPLINASSSSLPNRPSTPESLGKKEPNVVQASPIPVTAVASSCSSESYTRDTDDDGYSMHTFLSGTAKRKRLGTWEKGVSKRAGEVEALKMDGALFEEVTRQRLGTWDREAHSLPLCHSQVSLSSSSGHHVIPMEESVLVDIDGHTGEQTVILDNDLVEWLQEGLDMTTEHVNQPARIYTEDEDVFYSDFF
jgi:hypothetical protein